MPRLFEPWVGSDYQASGLSGLRLLALGESHYDTPGTERSSYTQMVVRDHINGTTRLPFFTKLCRALQMASSASNEIHTPDDILSKIAFCNFAQNFVTGVRVPLNTQQIDFAKEPLLQTIHETSPHVILILGLRLQLLLPSIPIEIRLQAVIHPSSSRFARCRQKPSLLLTLNILYGAAFESSRDRRSGTA